MDNRSDAFFKEAIKNLETAKNELLKPKGDVISYSICKNSQFAIENFLRGYLVKNNIEVELSDTIATLYGKCINFDVKFKTVDLSAIGCKEQPIDSRYCTEINTISACFDTADTIDTYLKKKNII